MWDLHTDLHTVIMINNTATPWQTGEEFREGPGTAPPSLLPSPRRELIFSQLPIWVTALTPGRASDSGRAGPGRGLSFSPPPPSAPSTLLLPRFELLFVPVLFCILGALGSWVCPKAQRLPGRLLTASFPLERPTHGLRRSSAPCRPVRRQDADSDPCPHAHTHTHTWPPFPPGSPLK